VLDVDCIVNSFDICVRYRLYCKYFFIYVKFWFWFNKILFCNCCL